MAAEKRHSTQPCVSLGTTASTSWVLGFLDLGSLLTRMCWRIIYYSEKKPLQISRVLSLSAWLSAFQSSALISLTSRPPHLRVWCLPASPVFSISVPQPGNSLRAASRAIRGLTVLVFHLQEMLGALLLLGQLGKSGPHCPEPHPGSGNRSP